MPQPTRAKCAKFPSFAIRHRTAALSVIRRKIDKMVADATNHIVCSVLETGSLAGILVASIV
ncbi:polyprotein [Anopheles sinensis]|uniref:Polyprotein n=1 Tax=Anopheles sinensis TaxID=74873 RepID=A0A084W560_ANOSI|nr:polyprotein [Anopheles sinensis]